MKENKRQGDMQLKYSFTLYYLSSITSRLVICMGIYYESYRKIDFTYGREYGRGNHTLKEITRSRCT